MRSVRLSAVSQRVKIVAESRADVAIDGTARVTRDGELTTIDRATSRITVRVPTGTDLVIGTTAGRVEVLGRVGSVSVITESGRIEIEQAAAVDARTNSARLSVGVVDGPCRAQSTSGRIEIGECAEAEAVTESGRIEMRRVSGAVRAHCVSGRVEIELVIAADVDAETVSGRIGVVLPAGTTAHRIGREPLPASPPPGYDCTVRTTSVSGRVEVRIP